MMTFHIAGGQPPPPARALARLRLTRTRGRAWPWVRSLGCAMMLMLSALPPLYAQPHKDWTPAARLVTHTLFTPQLNRDKQIWVYLPPDYGRDPQRRFPVLYMQDGQTLFEPKLTFPENSAIDATLQGTLRHALDWYGSWQINQQLDRLVTRSLLPGIIVVGISSAGGNRTAEYSPWPWYGALQTEADQYLEFLVHTVKPYVDRHYSTLSGRCHSGIGGSSLGGLVALYGGLKYQQVFSRIAAFSPVLIPDVSGQRLSEYIRRRGRSHSMKIYVDLGSEELNFGPLQPIQDALRSAGFGTQELRFRHVPGGRHRISDWGKRFPEALLWLYQGTNGYELSELPGNPSAKGCR